MDRNSVSWFEIYVQDMGRAKKFYEAVFLLELQRLENTELEMWKFPGGPEKAGAAGALVKMEGVSSGGNSTIVYFSCADCGEEAKRAGENGGKVFKEKFSIGEYGYIALISDTEGNIVGLHSLS